MKTNSNPRLVQVSNARTQQGASAIGMLFYVSVFSLLLTCVVKMGPVYMENWTFSKILESLPEQLAEEPVVSKSAIRNRLSKRMNIDMVDGVTLADISIDRIDDDFVIDAKYETRIALFANIDVVMSFDNGVAIPINP